MGEDWEQEPNRDSAQRDATEAGEATNSLLLTLVEELGGCRDVSCIYRKAARILGGAFSPFDCYCVIASDPGEGQWWSLPLENPCLPSWGGLAVHQLERESDTDSLALKHGKDISIDVLTHERFLSQLKNGGRPWQIQVVDDPDSTERLSTACGFEVASALGAGWTRPRGGRGWMFLVCRTARTFTQREVDLFYAAVKVTSRMAWYPGLVNGVLKQEKLNQALRRNIVHDLKSPIAVIKGSTQTLLQSWELLDEETKIELLQGVLEHAERVNLDLQDLLQPLQQVWEPHLEKVDVSRMLSRIKAAEGYTERAKHHDVVLEGADFPIEILADSRKIRRVFENLLGNALKYSPVENGDPKKVVIKVVKENEIVKISFQDFGIGMDDVQLARVMNRGGRVVDPRHGIEGTGFGLDSCRRILEAHKGWLHGSSKIGAGTTFTAVLPIRPPADDH